MGICDIDGCKKRTVWNDACEDHQWDTDMDPTIPVPKRFLLFGWCQYYPLGGWKDFQGWFKSIEEAKEFILSNRKAFDRYNIIDYNSGETVFDS